MKKIVLSNGIELKAETLIGYGEQLEIKFPKEESITKLLSIYSPNGELYKETVLREFSIYDEQDILQGVHYGYTKFISITSDGEMCTVKLEKENELLTRLEQQERTIADLLYIVANGGI